MKKIIISLLALLAVTAVQANNDYAKYYQNLPVQMPQPTLPTIPDNQLSILDCGGKGDGLTLNTEAFAKAISQLNKQGGGHLNVPAGIYLTGLISLKDNIDLHLEKNAIIVISEDKNDLIKIADAVPAEAKPRRHREGSKQSRIIEALGAPEGITLAGLVALTGWKAHSVRGVLANLKRAGVPVTSRKEGAERIYRTA